MLVYRQGDVILRSVHRSHVPKFGEVVVEASVKGETGDIHRLVETYRAYDTNGRVYVFVEE
jgi:hypothetical protein